MIKLKLYSKEITTFLLSSTILFGLYQASLYSYLLFHTVVELITIVIGCGIFIIAWNTRKLSENNFHLFLGTAFLFISILDFTHTLAYSGMNIFQRYDSNLPTQLWIAARFMQSLSLLLSFLLLRRKLNEFIILPVYFLITTILVICVFLNFFPVCYIEGTGLTIFKIISEYIISLILLAGIFLLLKNRNEFKPQVFKWLLASFVLSILSEISFTFYISVYGLSNLIGHIAKLFAFYMIYIAIIERGMMRPFDSLFKNLAESEERFHTLANTASDAIIIINSQGMIVFWNQATERIFGYSSPEMQGKSLAQIMPSEFRKDHADAIKRRTQTEKTRTIGKIAEVVGIHKTGSEVPLELSLSNWKTNDEVFYTAIIRKISERKELEEKIRLDSLMLTNINEGILLYKALDGNIIYANRQMEDIFGYFPGEFTGKHVSILNSSINTNPEEVAKEITELVKKTGKWDGEIQNITKDGKEIWCDANISSFTHKVYGEVFLTIQQDITERKESEAKYKRISDNSPAVLYQFMMSPTGTPSFLYVSDLVTDILGISPEDVLKDSSALLGMVHPEDQEIFQEAIVKSAATIESFPISFRCVKDEEVIWIEARGMPTPLPDGGILWDGFLIDITERKKEQELMQENEEKFRALVELANNVIVIVQDAIIVYVNPRVSTFFGFSEEEMTGAHINKIVHPDELDIVEANYKRHISGVDKFQNYDTAFLHKDGRRIEVNLSASLISYQGRKAGMVLVQDITERKKDELELEYKSTHDSLTGLYNRTFFDDELKRLQLGRRFPVSVIMADIDGLKIMNDKYGHDKGDLLLQRAAKVLAKSFRGDDMVARLGGDEFAALLPNTDAKTVKQTLLRIEKNINENNTPTNEIPLCISLGASTAENSKELDNSLLQADKNMYLDKNQ